MPAASIATSPLTTTTTTVTIVEQRPVGAATGMFGLPDKLHPSLSVALDPSAASYAHRHPVRNVVRPASHCQ